MLSEHGPRNEDSAQMNGDLKAFMAEPTNAITETGEKILFRSNTVTVTDKRLLFNTKTLTLSAIASINVESSSSQKKRVSRSSGYMPGVSVILAGAGFAIAGYVVGEGNPIVMGIFGLLGLFAVVVGIVIIQKSGGPRRVRKKQRGYSVKIHTVDGRKTRITGLNLREAQQMANVISAATTQV